ncbi:hypothetical protein FOZ63_018412, partial [Perkinsus olseni]
SWIGAARRVSLCAADSSSDSEGVKVEPHRVGIMRNAVSSHAARLSTLFLLAQRRTTLPKEMMAFMPSRDVGKGTEVDELFMLTTVASSLLSIGMSELDGTNPSRERGFRKESTSRAAACPLVDYHLHLRHCSSVQSDDDG